MMDGSGGGDDALATALRLMRLALPLLDRAGRPLATSYLQHAIDVARGAPVAGLTDEEMDVFLDGGALPGRGGVQG